MKILFVVKTIDFIDPMGMMLLSALAKQKGHKTYLTILARENFIEHIQDIQPDIIAYSASTGEHKYYLDINPGIKKRFPSIFTILGGPHITFYPDSLYEGKFDAVCKGEGEEAWMEVLDAIEKNQPVDDIQNIITPKKTNELRPLINDLDTLPFPDRDLFYEKTEMGDFAIKSFMTSRGCPYPCTYCFNHSIKKMYKGLGKFIRRVSVDYAFNEIKSVTEKYPLQFIKFYDDIFAYPKDKWLVEFAERYPKEIGIPFHCATRANLANPEMVKLLKSAGCHSVNMSIEAGNRELRNNILKRDMENSEIVKSFRLFRDADIKIFSNSIFGLPYSKIEHDIETLDLNLECKVHFAEFPICHPYPKTELGEYCIEEKIFDPNFKSLHMSYQNKSPLNCFTDKEKDVMKNLSSLAPLVLMFPFLRGIVVNKLIYWKPNK
ncbi:MAG: B12-binding domain-containing radical SAM protein, partial [Nitrospinae bacterium]|nr:B12-binding domain-containing radical SAM protein [Nitrospinota bacterium]